MKILKTNVEKFNRLTAYEIYINDTLIAKGCDVEDKVNYIINNYRNKWDKWNEMSLLEKLFFYFNNPIIYLKAL